MSVGALLPSVRPTADGLTFYICDYVVRFFFFFFFVDLAELRKKFEEDKARIQRLKQARKFKP